MRTISRALLVENSSSPVGGKINGAAGAANRARLTPQAAQHCGSCFGFIGWPPQSLGALCFCMLAQQLDFSGCGASPRIGNTSTATETISARDIAARKIARTTSGSYAFNNSDSTPIHRTRRPLRCLSSLDSRLAKAFGVGPPARRRLAKEGWTLDVSPFNLDSLKCLFLFSSLSLSSSRSSS